MKKAPIYAFEKATNKKPFVGTLADESNLRKNSWLKSGCNTYNLDNPQTRPISFWTENDILQYLSIKNTRYCNIYGEIIEKDGGYRTTKCNRTGCIFCAFGCHLEKKSRFLLLKETHPILHNYCMKPTNEGGLGMACVLDYINIKY